MTVERGNSHASAESLLEEGLRLEKAGLLDKALELYAQAREEAEDRQQVAVAWRMTAFAQHALGDWDAALEAANRSEALARELRRPDLVAEALNAGAAVHYGRGEFDAARLRYEEMLALAPTPRLRGVALQNLAIIHGRAGEYEQADQRLALAYRCFEEAEYAWGKAHVLNNRVGLALDRRQYDQAETGAREAIKLARQVDDLDLLAIATLNLAESLAGVGRLDESETEASIALGHFQRSGNRWRRIACFRLLGDVNEGMDEPEVAERFWRAGLGLAAELGAEQEAAELRARLDRLAG